MNTEIAKNIRVISLVAASGLVIFFASQPYAAEMPEGSAPVEHAAGTAGGSSDFTKYDANGDGKLSPKEVAGDKALAGKFKMADLNADGFLSSEEYDNLKKASVVK